MTTTTTVVVVSAGDDMMMMMTTTTIMIIMMMVINTEIFAYSDSDDDSENCDHDVAAFGDDNVCPCRAMIPLRRDYAGRCSCWGVTLMYKRHLPRKSSSSLVLYPNFSFRRANTGRNAIILNRTDNRLKHK